MCHVQRQAFRPMVVLAAGKTWRERFFEMGLLENDGDICENDAEIS